MVANEIKAQRRQSSWVPKRVLLTNFYGDMGGGEFALLEHAKWLVKRGVRVDVCLFQKGAFTERLKKAGCIVHVVHQRLDCGPRGAWLVSLKLVPRLTALLLSVRPDYVLVYTHQEMPFVMQACRICRIPVFYRDQGRPPSTRRETDWRRKRLAALVRKPYVGVLPTTRAQSEFLLSLGAPRDRVRHVYLGVDRRRFGISRTAKSEVLHEFGIPPNTIIIGFFGRLVAWKGHSVFLHALQLLHHWIPFRAMIVGGKQLNKQHGTEYESKLADLTRQLGLEGRVQFTGFRTDVPRLMSACDIVCHASHWEAFGLVLVEAMFCGKPVVASDVSGPREIVVHGKTGYLFPVGDHRALATYLERLLSDPNLREALGREGRDRATRLFDLQANLDALDQAIWSLMPKKQGWPRRLGLL